MASSLFVNTLQVDFASSFAMEHIGMIRMFKSLEDTGLRGFLEGTTSIFENVVTELFVNAKVIAGTFLSTVCSLKLVVTEDIFSAAFKLPIEGITGLAHIPKETIAEMRNEHQAHDEHGSVQGSDRSLKERSAAIVLPVTNLETITTSEKNNSTHQGPAPSNLQLVVPPPTDLSTLQFMDTTAQTLTNLSTRVSSLDLTYSRIRDDTNLTRHHTTLIRDQLKNAVEGLDIKIDVLESTLSQRIDDSHQHFTKLETTIVRNYADSQQQLVDELASLKSQLATMVESIKKFGVRPRVNRQRLKNN
ncbi:hypothetical protein F511_37931 [Dorcoceras hygrometricum]|uniref:Uncharacterized protein n=1 Tax=Dorcoceras hygrometricum TaxID=472368 RepID=A0A2Z7C322_9LAMI|nr:hypothetical protein F511_37931 [Dorcoceras hygrometricum]